MRVHLCGGKDRRAGWINVDARDFGQEVVANIENRWGFVEEGTVSEIYCKDGFEREHYQFFHPGVMFYKDKL
jgi:predicted SAM-dependent methyltransferase